MSAPRMSTILVAIVAAATNFSCGAPPLGDDEAIVKFENDAVEANLGADTEFFEDRLVEDWSRGMSSGAFQTKAAMMSNLRHADRRNAHDSIANLTVRLYGDAAVATYSEAYDLDDAGRRRAGSIITTDSFVKDDGRWLLVASHSSSVRPSP